MRDSTCCIRAITTLSPVLRLTLVTWARPLSTPRAASALRRGTGHLGAADCAQEPSRTLAVILSNECQEILYGVLRWRLDCGHGADPSRRRRAGQPRDPISARSPLIVTSPPRQTGREVTCAPPLAPLASCVSRSIGPEVSLLAVQALAPPASKVLRPPKGAIQMADEMVRRGGAGRRAREDRGRPAPAFELGRAACFCFALVETPAWATPSGAAVWEEGGALSGASACRMAELTAGKAASGKAAVVGARLLSMRNGLVCAAASG